MIAVSCGTPTPATMRVVQIEPGPMPDLHRIRPGIDQRRVASAVATLPAMTCTELESFFTRSTASRDVPVVAMRGVDDDHVALGIDQRLGPLEALVADGGRRGHAQAAGRVLGRVGVESRPSRYP